ncbi:hypothetical protein FI615_001668 [Enterococcus faecium]|uniref:hypothetical protein n=1 Tax=Enterococcus faecium TaxID=1352 RepID=UPI001920587D|nr:hypothetical protein [Enterococcus faecium]EGP4894182.1 hypothetical protein [Enterococcus faecium]EHK9936731.1 hypothetical protein [Enterococcus faecium]EME7158832.1 hypothetical protein [Enterococcus faecium]MBL3708805.1 hypothetical protein [Enterococcus faecium]
MREKPKITVNGTPNLQRLADEMARIRSRQWGVTVVATIIEQKEKPTQPASK